LKGKCRKGHLIEGDNAYVSPSTGQTRCVKCKRGYNLRWNREHRGSKWTEEDYDVAMRKQHGKCAVCGNPPEFGKHLQGDHDHESGKSRELLCNRCNLVLGILEDDLELLRKALAYLQKHKAQ
jgi:hypothetical protein